MNNNINNYGKRSPMFVTFAFAKYNKQIFFDANKRAMFEQCINKMCEGYNWIKLAENKTYYLKVKLIKENKYKEILENFKIKDDININIIINDKIDQSASIDGILQNIPNKIAVNFKIFQGSINNKSNVIDITNIFFGENSTVEDVLLYFINNQNDLKSGLQSGKCLFEP